MASAMALVCQVVSAARGSDSGAQCEARLRIQGVSFQRVIVDHIVEPPESNGRSGRSLRYTTGREEDIPLSET
jgi:hypothetical protein